ncbi:MAG: GCN5-related N-acetyltransferase [Bacteroidota bacterium]|jgi:GNAT superfamily N-acetyltransferase|nr:GCN5-related N-acetyltransferase [Bacteroidota bacterium]
MSRREHIGGFVFSTSKEALDIAYIHQYLSTESYWAKNIPFETVKKSIEGSLCFGVYHLNEQVGFCRVITDHSTFAYLADVFIDKRFRGKGLSKNLMKFVLQTESLQNVRRFMLATLDAHRLYEKFGFNPLKEPERFMEIKPFETY